MSDVIDLPTEPRPRRFRWPFTWLGLLALCFIIYELTHQPALGAIAVCLKFGWDDFAAARWLARTDPVRERGRCCSWLYFAWGLWKTAVVAFLMSIAFASLAPRKLPQGGARDLLLAFLGTFLTTLACFALSTLATSLAVWFAWRGGHRLWLSRGASRAHREDFWPPAPLCAGQRNHFGLLLLTSVGLSAVAALLIGLALLDGLLPGARNAPFVVLALAMTVPVAISVTREVISERVRARSPDECWHGDEGPPHVPYRGNEDWF